MFQAERLRNLPPYLFEEIDRKIREGRARGVDGCIEAVKDPLNHRYPSSQGKATLREAIAQRCKADYGVDLDPEREITSLLGSKEGIHNIHLVYVNPGDIVLYPNPGYPVYRISPTFCGGKPYKMPLKDVNGFLPDLASIPEAVVKKAKIIWINYPNNPTAATAEKSFYREVMDFAIENDLILCSDEAYSKIAYEGYKPPSLIEVEGALEHAIVFSSLSKTYNMTGWRIGYAVGAREIISGLVKLKGNVDSGTCQFIQDATRTALSSSQECVTQNMLVYQKRRDLLVGGLRKLGYKVDSPKATFYLWMKVPGQDSIAFATKLLEKGVVVTPGVGFGEHGEGYVRFALTQPSGRIKEALERLE
jgi:LL-diaminopimelate aminotransferase